MKFNINSSLLKGSHFWSFSTAVRWSQDWSFIVNFRTCLARGMPSWCWSTPIKIVPWTSWARALSRSKTLATSCSLSLLNSSTRCAWQTQQRDPDSFAAFTICSTPTVHLCVMKLLELWWDIDSFKRYGGQSTFW